MDKPSLLSDEPDQYSSALQSPIQPANVLKRKTGESSKKNNQKILTAVDVKRQIEIHIRVSDNPTRVTVDKLKPSTSATKNQEGGNKTLKPNKEFHQGQNAYQHPVDRRLCYKCHQRGHIVKYCPQLFDSTTN
jgi:hypothetical protein